MVVFISSIIMNIIKDNFYNISHNWCKCLIIATFSALISVILIYLNILNYLCFLGLLFIGEIFYFYINITVHFNIILGFFNNINSLNLSIKGFFSDIKCLSKYPIEIIFADLKFLLDNKAFMGSETKPIKPSDSISKDKGPMFMNNSDLDDQDNTGKSSPYPKENNYSKAYNICPETKEVRDFIFKHMSETFGYTTRPRLVIDSSITLEDVTSLDNNSRDFLDRLLAVYVTSSNAKQRVNLKMFFLSCSFDKKEMMHICYYLKNSGDVNNMNIADILKLSVKYSKYNSNAEDFLNREEKTLYNRSLSKANSLRDTDNPFKKNGDHPGNKYLYNKTKYGLEEYKFEVKKSDLSTTRGLNRIKASTIGDSSERVASYSGMRDLRTTFKEVVKEPYMRQKSDNMPDSSDLYKISDPDRIVLAKYCREVKIQGTKYITFKDLVNSKENFSDKDLHTI